MKRFLSVILTLVLFFSLIGIAEDAPAFNAISLEEGLEIEAPLEATESEASPENTAIEDLGEPVPDAIPEFDPLTGIPNVSVPKKLTLGVKETYALDYPGATFKTSKKSIVTVDKTGKITAKKKGSAKITVKADGKTVATYKVTVLAAPKKVTLDKTKLTLPMGSTATLEATLPKNTVSNKITWKSSNKKIVKVDKKGALTPVKPGQAKITVTTFNQKKATCTVTVTNDPFELSFPIKSISIGLGESVTIEPVMNEGAKTTFTWSSKKKTVATVSKKGKITGKKVGSTKITVKSKNGLTATLTVKVLKKPGKVTLSDVTVEVGSTVQLKAKLPSKTASYKRSWKSSDKKVARVDAKGLVTAVKPGTATISVTTFNKKTATCTVTVNAKPEPTMEPTAAPTEAATAEPTMVPTTTPESSIAPTMTPEVSTEPTTTPEPGAEATATPEPTADPSKVITNPDLQGVADTLGMTAEQIQQATGLSLEALNSMNIDQIYALEFATDNIKWKFSGDRNSAIILGVVSSRSKLTIPGTVCNLTATEIGAGAFEGDSVLEEITLPKTIRKIGDNAFNKCENLWGIW